MERVQLAQLTADVEVVQKLGTYPNQDDGLSADELKQKFDEGCRIIKEYLNSNVVVAVNAIAENSAGLKAALNSIMELDTTLSINGKAADAKAVGDKIEEVSEAAVEAANESLAKKLDKVKKTGSILFYGVNTTGEQYMHGGAINAVASTVALRGSDGTLNVGTPTLDTHAVTKKYVDDNATEVYRATYDIYTNVLNGDFSDLYNAFASGKVVMLTCDTPEGNIWSFCCDGYEPADYWANEYGQECLVFRSCSTESIRTLYVCADGTIQEQYVNIGDIDAALDRIIAIQNSLIGGE